MEDRLAFPLQQASSKFRTATCAKRRSPAILSCQPLQYFTPPITQPAPTKWPKVGLKGRQEVRGAINRWKTFSRPFEILGFTTFSEYENGFDDCSWKWTRLNEGLINVNRYFGFMRKVSLHSRVRFIPFIIWDKFLKLKTCKLITFYTMILYFKLGLATCQIYLDEVNGIAHLRYNLTPRGVTWF